MKQTIEIDVPDGYKAVYNEDTQRVEIVKIGLPKTWEEFCGDNPIKKNEYFIDEYGEITYAAEKHRATNLKNILPNKETAEAFRALMQLIHLRDCYRQGWTPDWEQPYKKYCIYCEGNSVFPFDSTFNSRVLSFQSENISEDFLANFRDLIYKAKELI